MFDEQQPPLLEDEYEQALRRGGEEYAKAYTEGFYDGLQYTSHISPFKCPVCDGTAKVSRPPWIAGDVTEWTASETSYECVTCEKGIIWR